MIENTIAHDKEFNSLSEYSQLLYLKILPHTDDFGRFEGEAEILKARVDPLSKRSVTFIDKAIEEISKKGLWFVFETDSGRRVIQFKADAFDRINAFLIKKRGKSEFPEFNKDLYRVISGDITYKVISRKKEVESKKQKEPSEKTLEVEPHILQKFILENCPNISLLENQLTHKDAEKLFSEFSETELQVVIEAMENYKPLVKKYKSVNLTMRNWLRRDRENGTNNRKSPRGTIDFSKWESEAKIARGEMPDMVPGTIQ